MKQKDPNIDLDSDEDVEDEDFNAKVGVNTNTLHEEGFTESTDAAGKHVIVCKQCSKVFVKRGTVMNHIEKKHKDKGIKRPGEEQTAEGKKAKDSDEKDDQEPFKTAIWVSKHP